MSTDDHQKLIDQIKRHREALKDMHEPARQALVDLISYLEAELAEIDQSAPSADPRAHP
jgi:NTP pyrophosphatase (non-canonical NTP hydrolase)